MSIDPFTIQLAKLFKDFSIRRSVNEMIRVIDFSIDDLSLGNIIVEGDYSSISLSEYRELGIPMPEGTNSPRGLVIQVKAGGTVYVRVPSPMKAFKPFVAYTDIYAIDADVNVLMYITLGGQLQGYRQKLPRYLRLPQGKWGRLVTHWFMELHHGQAEVIIEINNPSSNNVRVVIGIINISVKDPYIKGHCMLWGWEDTYELSINNETLDLYIPLFLYTNAGKAVSMSIEYAIAGDGTNPLNITVQIFNGGTIIVQDSNASTTPKFIHKAFNISLVRSGVWGYESVTIKVTLSTSGSGKLTKLCIVLYAYTDEYEYTIYKSSNVSGGQNTKIIDYSTQLRHIKYAKLTINNSSNDNDVEVYIDGPSNDILVATIGAGVTKTIEIHGRFTYVRINNKGSHGCSIDEEYRVVEAVLTKG